MSLNETQVRSYRDRISQIGDMHLEFERQFGEFSNVIPYRYNWDIREQIFSPSLYSLLQGINSANDGILRILGELFSVQPQKQDAFHYMDSLNVSGMLKIQAVAPLEHPKILTPFQDLNPGKAPTWWTDYNHTKHKLPEGMSKATLDNTIQALGALLIFLQISYTRLLNSPYKAMLKAEHWHDSRTEFESDYERLKFESVTSSTLSFQTTREYLHSQRRKYKSQIFYYLSEFHRPSR